MNYAPVAPRLRPEDSQPLTSKKLQFAIRLQIVIIHCAVIFGPLGYLLYLNWRFPQETVFKVNLIGPLSTGPVVGEPSRLRPSSNPGPLPPAPTPPAPTPPAPPSVPRQATPPPPTVPRQVAPRPPVVPRVTPKPPAVTPPRNNRATPPATPPRNQTATGKRNQSSTARPRQLTAEEQVALARQNAAKYGDGGGSNYNNAVPIGNADRAQALGPQNNGTPGGGASRSNAADAAYRERLGNYVKTRWVEPPGSLLGSARPTVLIELAIAADGRVSSSKIVQPSGIRAMDESVRRLLDSLDRVPAPANGTLSIQILLRTSD